MPAVSFSTMKDKILNGEKKQTIRPKRSDYWLQWEEGDRLIGYWKQRSPGESEKLFDSELSEDPFVTKIYRDRDKEYDKWEFIEEINRENKLAIRDGFEGLNKMHLWFMSKYGEKCLDWDFVVLRWK